MLADLQSSKNFISGKGTGFEINLLRNFKNFESLQKLLNKDPANVSLTPHVIISYRLIRLTFNLFGRILLLKNKRYPNNQVLRRCQVSSTLRLLSLARPAMKVPTQTKATHSPSPTAS